MNVTGQDRRVKYTKTMIRQALFELMEKKPLEKITVTEICALADVNRGTFYKYYFDVKDLFAKLENEYYTELTRILNNELANAMNPSNTDFLNFRYDTILNTIKANKDLTLILMNSRNSDLLKKLISYVKDDVNVSGSLVFPDLPAEKAEYIYSYIINGSVGMITTWLENGMRMSVDDLCQLIAKINNIASLLTASRTGR